MKEREQRHPWPAGAETGRAVRTQPRAPSCLLGQASQPLQQPPRGLMLLPSPQPPGDPGQDLLQVQTLGRLSGLSPLLPEAGACCSLHRSPFFWSFSSTLLQGPHVPPSPHPFLSYPLAGLSSPLPPPFSHPSSCSSESEASWRGSSNSLLFAHHTDQTPEAWWGQMSLAPPSPALLCGLCLRWAHHSDQEPWLDA